MTEKKGSMYYLFCDYLRPGISDWIDMSEKDALVADAPKIARIAFKEYVRKQSDRIRKGMIS